MVVDNLLLTAAVALVTGMLMVVLYYTMIVAPITLADFEDDDESDHQPALDDDMIYFTYSMYPYHEFMYFNALPPKAQPQGLPQAS